MSLIGVLSGTKTSVNLTRILMQQIRIQGIFVGHRDAYLRMLQACEDHTIRPQVHACHDFEALPTALNQLRSGEHFGKITLAMGSH